MKPFIVLALALTFAAAASAAQIFPANSPPQHVTIAAGADRIVASPGAAVSLWVDVTPNPKIHVYGKGAKGFTPVSLAVSKQPAFAARAPKYPMPQLLATPGDDAPVPAYARPFRVVQPIVLAKTVKSGQMVNVSGTLSYESCDDRQCYPASSIPVYWTIRVK